MFFLRTSLFSRASVVGLYTTLFYNIGTYLYTLGWSWFGGYNKKQITETVVSVHPETAYIEKHTSRLMKTFLVDNHRHLYNTSIDPIFYSTEKYDVVIQDPKNELEAAWKRRILIESTPRTSVVMFYDAFKHGFSYYSDQYVPYSILNAVSMKYVIMYRCRDFFLDEAILFDEKRSPFLDIQEEEERLEKEKKGAENKEKGLAAIDVRSGPFAKLKQYSGTSKETMFVSRNVDSNKDTKDTKDTKDKETKEYAKNRFIHLGKWTNVSILNKMGVVGGTISAKKQQPEIPMKFKEYMALKMQIKA